MIACERRDIGCVLYEKHGPRVCENRGCEYSPIKVEGKDRGCCPYVGRGALMCSNNKCPEIRDGGIAYVE